MSCDTGEGHNSAARALVGAFNRRNIDCTLIDPLIFRGRKASEIVSASYTAMLRKAPALFGIIYKAGDIYSSTRIVSPVYYANSKYAPACVSISKIKDLMPLFQRIFFRWKR